MNSFTPLMCLKNLGWLPGGSKRPPRILRLRRLLLAVLLLFVLAPGARAEVVLTFYSHHLGTYGLDIAFPHAFIVLGGTVGPNNKPVKANFGFTAPTVGPAILWGSVEGSVVSMQDDYIAASQPHFSLPISDQQYHAVLAVVDHWRNYPQPSYNLDTHNCVTFVKEIAVALQLPASDDPKFIRSPKEFLEDLHLRTPMNNRVAMVTPGRQFPHSQPPTNTKNTVRPDGRLAQAIVPVGGARANELPNLNSARATNILSFVGEWSPVAGICDGNTEKVPLKITPQRAEASGGICEFKSVRPERSGIWRVAAVCSVDGSSWKANIRLAVTATGLKWSSEKGEETYYRCAN